MANLSLNTTTVVTMTFGDMERELQSYWVVNVPVADSPDFAIRVQENMSQIPTVHAFVNRLWAIMANEVRVAKHNKVNTEQINELTAKRDYLEALGKSLKMAYDASSRMVTIKQDQNQANGSYARNTGRPNTPEGFDNWGKKSEIQDIHI